MLYFQNDAVMYKIESTSQYEVHVSRDPTFPSEIQGFLSYVISIKSFQYNFPHGKFKFHAGHE